MNKGLSGIEQPVDVQAQINKALEEQRLQNELKALRAEVAKKNKKLKKLKKLTEEGESGFDKLNEFVKGGIQLAGSLGFNSGNGMSGTPQPEAEVEVEIEEDEGRKSHSKDELSESESIFNDLVEAYGEKGIKNVLGWIATLAAHPEIQHKIQKELKKKNDGEA